MKKSIFFMATAKLSFKEVIVLGLVLVFQNDYFCINGNRSIKSLSEVLTPLLNDLIFNLIKCEIGDIHNYISI